ncbi:mechanosensitive ion channel family protein [Salinigranum marinum]|uniref:mechanosensitive ion channel family protein n=1 Tax=Salinigranum marinum TaxID=1515595 RepID=UPI00298A053B|nr:mechanosensitive ion channel family protein [Salinigranum marinum]
MDTVAVALQTAIDESQTLADLLPAWAKFPGWRLVVVVVVLVVGAYASKYVVRLAGRPIARRFRRQSVAQTMLKLVRVLTILLAGAFGLNVVGIELGNIVLSVTVFSAVIGIVLAPIIGSVINGLFILADQPYEIGDMIELDDGTRGFVDDITLRYTKMFTLDNTFLVIPNATIRERDVTNYSAEDERTRLSLPVLVTYESDIDKARGLLERAGRQCNLVIEGGPDIRIGSARYPARPTAYIDQYADNGITLTLRYWAKKPYKLGTVRSRVLTNLGALLESDGDEVEMAYPHQHHVFDDTSGIAQVALRNGDRRDDEDDLAADRASGRETRASSPTEQED